MRRPPISGKKNKEKYKIENISRRFNFTRNKEGLHDRVTPRNQDKFALTHGENIGTSLRNISNAIEKAVGKFNEEGSSRMSTERKNNFNSYTKSTSSLSRAESALDHIKDQDYVNQIEEKQKNKTNKN